MSSDDLLKTFQEPVRRYATQMRVLESATLYAAIDQMHKDGQKSVEILESVMEHLWFQREKDPNYFDAVIADIQYLYKHADRSGTGGEA